MNEYYIYLNNLYHNKSLLLSGVITDLLTVIFNNKKYNLVLDIYNNLKKRIHNDLDQKFKWIKLSLQNN